MGNANNFRRLIQVITVHPHVHGERGCRARKDALRVGSSPRTWGTHMLTVPLLLPLRFIPTYMGNAGNTGGRTGRDEVHPHVHGERWHEVAEMPTSIGSSPRTWGTLHRQDTVSVYPRFIPTYMGNALSWLRLWLISPVHPHVHGERVVLAAAASWSCGSSPRTWGTPGRCLCNSAIGRFIPTYMGNAMESVSQ